MSADSFSKIASGIQSFVIIVSLVIGAWWAAATFVFQNPAFFERGHEFAGVEPEFLKIDLSLENLNVAERQYEITISVNNLSKTLNQLVIAKQAKVIYFQPGETTSNQATFSSSSSATEIEIEYVPVLGSRQFRFFAEFPRDGVYVVEVDLCKGYGHNCLVQKYVSVNSANK